MRTRVAAVSLCWLVGVLPGCGSDRAPAGENGTANAAAGAGASASDASQAGVGGGPMGGPPFAASTDAAHAGDAGAPNAATRDAGATQDAATTAPPRDAAAEPPACGACSDYAAPVLLANVQAMGLEELSGVAASGRTPGTRFVHNDRARPVIYALDEDGVLRAQWTLQGAKVADVEDLAVGPCPAGTCLYLADIGGNLSPRTEFAILRLAEPELPGGAFVERSTTEYAHYRFAYDDGRNHNAEGLLVDPGSGTVYVVTKLPDGQPSAIYRLPNPLLEADLNVAVEVTTLPVPRAANRAVSAAAAHPCGRGFVVRTYDTVFEFRIPLGAAFEDAFSVAAVEVPAASEPQSEAITYRPDGSAIITTGEGAAAPIYVTGCR
jgi:hypothetical protein